MIAPARSAADYLPQKPHTLDSLRLAAQGCRGCDLYKQATHVVFGEGISPAKIFVVGEVPGNAEDKKGRPFVGPAGALLDRALREAQIDRSQVYVTNTVKHFRFMRMGGYRYHRNPSGLQIQACRPWLEAELQLVRPSVIICLGVTAARAVLRREVSVSSRGELVSLAGGVSVLLTVHPSYLLHMMQVEKDEMVRAAVYNEFLSDLLKVKHFLRKAA